MRIVKGLLIAGLVFFLLGFLSICILAVSGGNNDNLRRGLEQFLTDYTGMSAIIDTLENAEFYPDLVMDVREVSLRQTPNTPDPGVTIGAIDVRMRFWDALLSRGLFWSFVMKDFHARPAAFLPGDLAIKTLEIVPQDAQHPVAALVLTGSYNGFPLSFQASLETVPVKRGLLYRLDDRSAIHLSIGTLDLSATLHPVSGKRGFSAENLEIRDHGAGQKGESGRLLAQGSMSFLDGIFTLSVTSGETHLALSMTRPVSEDARAETPEAPQKGKQAGAKPEKDLAPAPETASSKTEMSKAAASKTFDVVMTLSSLSEKDLAADGALGILAARSRAIFVPRETPKQALADISARIVMASGAGAIKSGIFSGPVQCAAAMAQMKGTLLSFDPLWIDRNGAAVTGTAQYDLETNAFSGKTGGSSDPKSLTPFLSGASAPSGMSGVSGVFGSDPACKAALGRGMNNAP